MSLLIDYQVPPLSWAAIGRISDYWRGELGCADEAHLPIVEIFEGLAGQPSFFELYIETKSVMGDAEGQTCPRGSFIRLREDVYDAACRQDGRARFTLAHEFGHWVLHSNLPLQRVMDRAQVRPYRLAEPQANAFAARFLMPAHHLLRTSPVEEIMRRFGVTKTAAANRLSDFLKDGS